MRPPLPNHADARSGIYSFGCTLCHLIKVQTPFSGASLAEKTRAHEEEGKPSIEVALSGCSLRLGIDDLPLPLYDGAVPPRVGQTLGLGQELALENARQKIVDKCIHAVVSCKLITRGEGARVPWSPKRRTLRSLSELGDGLRPAPESGPKVSRAGQETRAQQVGNGVERMSVCCALFLASCRRKEVTGVSEVANWAKCAPSLGKVLLQCIAGGQLASNRGDFAKRRKGRIEDFLGAQSGVLGN